MADRGASDLPYGQFGRAVYDPDEQTWRYERKATFTSVLRPLGEPRVVIAPPSPPPPGSSPSFDRDIPSVRHRKQIQSLVKRFPDLQPATALLPPLLRASEAIEAAAAHHDPLKGDLLAFGTIPSIPHHHPVRVAAFPTGPTGSDLRIVQVRTQRRGWDDKRKAWIEVPVIHGPETTWHGEGAPIQQVCFAHALELTDSYLAVRLPTRTVVFRPILQKVSASGPATPRLEANVILVLEASITGGLPHVDVAFNPWFPRQFGVVGQAGKWEVWQLDGRHKTQSRRVFASSIGLERTVQPGNAKPTEDGWARITWVLSSSSVLVCNRRELLLHSITEDNSHSEPFTVSDLTKSPAWILDIKVVPSQPAHVCVLTSTHVSIFAFHEDRWSTLSTQVASSTRHHRSPQDTTLKLDVALCQETVHFFIRSDMDSVVTVHSMILADTGNLVMSIPYEVKIPQGTGLNARASLFVLDAPYGTESPEIGASEHIPDDYQGVHILSLFLLQADGLLTQTLFYVSPARHTRPPSALTWDSRLAAHRAPRKQAFVADDDEAKDSEVRTRPLSAYVRRRRADCGSRKGVGWTISLESVAVKLDKSIAEEAELIDKFADLVNTDGRLLYGAPWRTLRQHFGDNITAMRPNRLLAKLEEMTLATVPKPLPSQDGDALSPTDEDWTVQRLSSRLTTAVVWDYQTMSKDWIDALPGRIPEETLAAREECVKRTFTEVALASFVNRPQPVTEQPMPSSQNDTQESLQTRSLTIRGRPSSSQAAASQRSTLPTPSPSATPSITTGSSHPSSFAAPAISRLSRYTTFSRSAPPALPRSLSRVLSHWQVGTDPTTYDWRATAHRISRRDEEAEEAEGEMTTKERARVQRRAERHIRRQRREAAASQAAQMATGNAPEIVSFSQPLQRTAMDVLRTVDSGVAGTESQRSIPGVGGSQEQSQSQSVRLATASQVVSGRFGGRPAKKKRKQGF
ncbi:hypothetical protein BAUCODRAFT_163449 [Baudoinia panamericana UAMH 10762]|uniref:RNA polymerase I-specific transcription initiation factor RRN6-like protein n=1 Tax=Baudoinia panamericana (strain UAMH 10762) TaxID=717646 RepID=M2N8D9_BAUPA|nr:uncharacterized protein BAUCODRAFT_163449 [Baudoinia panamericana UAMH 10762]EMD00409.1 hypothetical protein BAUCODRAFT_163449 [Baudoinia panamericana UAMH 10762]